MCNVIFNYIVGSIFFSFRHFFYILINTIRNKLLIFSQNVGYFPGVKLQKNKKIGKSHIVPYWKITYHVCFIFLCIYMYLWRFFFFFLITQEASLTVLEFVVLFWRGKKYCNKNVDFYFSANDAFLEYSGLWIKIYLRY